MVKAQIFFKDIEHEILSPGDIYWRQKSGSEVLISKKGDLLNWSLIKKLDSNQHELLIENKIDQHLLNEFVTYFSKYSEEMLMKNKIEWREKIIELINREFIEKNRSQFELNYIGFKLFSNLKREDVEKFIERDLNFFSRNFSVASAYTFCAFLMGYYNEKFLQEVYTQTLSLLMDVGAREHMNGLKNELEILRLKKEYNAQDILYLKNIFNEKILSGSVFLEKYDGSGVRTLNKNEMNDLDLAFMALNEHFSFVNEKKGNVFLDLNNRELSGEKRVVEMVRAELVRVSKKNMKEAV